MAEQHPIPTSSRFQDLTGQTFGKLTVLFYAGKRKNKYSMWHCRCECGNETTLESSRLTLGQTTSCQPCFRHKPKTKRRSDFEDLTGRTFGRLTVVSMEKHEKLKKGSRTHWLCRCECGESCVVRGDALKEGKQIGCGCATTVRAWRSQPKPDTKKCTRCGQEKPFNLDFFYNHPFGRWGFDAKCKDCAKEISNRAAKRLAGKARMRCLIHYSGDPPKCQCPGCDRTHLEFLTIDHINNDGAAHRRSINFKNIYSWLIQNNFPPGFRVLCWCCNASRGKYGYCPHERST